MYHRDLHSFPTRRSSDLEPFDLDLLISWVPRSLVAPVDKGIRVNPYDRSEEHTSELQSRQYLVCRLLLEKKNTSVCPKTSRTKATLGRRRPGSPTRMGLL